MKKPNAKLEFYEANLTPGFKRAYQFETDDEAKQFFDELKSEALNNKIQWRQPSERAYDGSELNPIRFNGYGDI